MKQPFRIGEMDQRVTLQREVLTPDGMGGNTLALTTIATVWALVRPRGGKEIEYTERLNGQAAYMFVIRQRDDIQENDRINWQGVDYNIRMISRLGGRNLYLEIDAERGVAQ